MGGDEFVVLIDGVSLNSSPELVAQRLLDVMRQPFALGDAASPLTVNTSVGIAMGDRTNPGDLLRDADVALYQAKAAGKNRYEIFHPEMQTEISECIELEFDLRSALQDDQFRLDYQPIYNLDDISLVAVEALLRWQHPRRGLIQPDEFVPILEHSGQIREVGRWVLREACAQTAKWHAGGDLLDLSVNVSGRQLDDDAIIDHIREALTDSGLEATALIVEVTETALMRNAGHERDHHVTRIEGAHRHSRPARPGPRSQDSRGGSRDGRRDGSSAGAAGRRSAGLPDVTSARSGDARGPAPRADTSTCTERRAQAIAARRRAGGPVTGRGPIRVRPGLSS